MIWTVPPALHSCSGESCDKELVLASLATPNKKQLDCAVTFVLAWCITLDNPLCGTANGCRLRRGNARDPVSVLSLALASYRICHNPSQRGYQTSI